MYLTNEFLKEVIKQRREELMHDMILKGISKRKGYSIIRNEEIETK